MSESQQTPASSEQQVILLDGCPPAPPPLADQVLLQLPAECGHVTGSSCVRQRTVVDYAWENRRYPGRLVAAHGDFLAYAIASAAEPAGGAVRILARAGQKRALLKGLRGAVLDLAFSACNSEALLAVADSGGVLTVARVLEDAVDALTVELCLKLVHGDVDSLREGLRCRALWCPYVPDDCSSDSGGEEAWRLLLWSHGCSAELVNVATLLEEVEGGRVEARPVLELEEGVVRLDALPAAIIDTCFSPDGSALAVACADGLVRFYQTEQADSEGVLLVLHQWRPHAAPAPLAALHFLDDHQGAPEQQRQFWRAALTAAGEGRELRVWSCHDWQCRQTVRIEARGECPLQLTVHVDPAARHVLLSDRSGRRLVLLDIVEERTGDVSVMRLSFPRCLLLMQPVLSLAVCSSSDIELTGSDDGGDALVTGRQIICYTVQPRSLQETTLILDPPPNPAADESNSASSRNVSSSRSDGSPSAFSQIPPSLNLLTPEAFVSACDTLVTGSSPEHTEVKPDLRSAINSNGSSPSIEVQEIMLGDSASTSTITASAAADKPPRLPFPSPPHVAAPLPASAACRCVTRAELDRSVRAAVAESVSGELDRAAVAAAISGAVHERLQTSVQKAEARLEQLTVQSVSELEQRLTKLINSRLSSAMTQAVSAAVSQAVPRAVTQAVSSTLEQQCRALFSSALLPAYERSCRELLTQLGASLSAGSREVLQRLEESPAARQLQHSAQMLGESVQREVEARRHSDVLTAQLHEEVRRLASAVQQREETPAPPAQPDPQEQQERVRKLVAAGRDSAALQLALTATDLELLTFTCRLLPPARVFSQQHQPLAQPVLLSLVQQLSAELRSEGQLKLEYLREALLCLEPGDAAVRDHLADVLAPLARKLHQLLADNPTHKLMRNVHMICNSLLPRS